MTRIPRPSPRPAALLAAVMATTLACGPVAAQTQPEPAPPPAEAPLDELGDAARRAVEEMLARLAPFFEMMRNAVDELNAYEAPRMLPNGDILIPRKREPAAPQDEAPETLEL